VLLGDAAKTASPLPSFDPKSLEFPSVQLPQLNVEIPQVNLDGLKAFTVDIPQIDTSALKVDDSILLPAAGLAGVFVVLAVLNQFSDDSSEGGSFGGSPTRSRRKKTKTSVLAIPYDAAASLAYDKWLKEHEEKYNEDGYMVFKTLYEALAVSEATSKKLARDLDTFENKAPPPKPNRRITAKKKTSTDKVSPFFFAE